MQASQWRYVYAVWHQYQIIDGPGRQYMYTKPTITQMQGRQVDLSRAAIRQIGSRRVKGASDDKQSESIMIDATWYTAEEGSNQSAASVNYSADMTVLPHRTALRPHEKLRQCQYQELEGGHVPDRCRPGMITYDETRILRQDGRHRNRQNSTALDRLSRFRTSIVYNAP